MVRQAHPVALDRVFGAGKSFVERAPADLLLRPGHNTATDRVQSSIKFSDKHKKYMILDRT